MRGSVIFCSKTISVHGLDPELFGGYPRSLYHANVRKAISFAFSTGITFILCLLLQDPGGTSQSKACDAK